MHELKPASIHVKRHLEPAERVTIAAALEHFTTSLSIEDQIERLAKYPDEFMPLSPSAAAALATELMSARKVKVCRSKRKPS